MIIQLPNGRIIECSLEQYYSLTDEEYYDLNGLGNAYTKEVTDPFYSRFSKASGKNKNDKSSDDFDEREKALDEIKPFEKLEDKYFHPDDN
tara:strand:- start:220 stop:492 length:273 start_codon:yes stop_codon:yes gene_type:complete